MKSREEELVMSGHIHAVRTVVPQTSAITKLSFPEELLLIRELTHRINNKFTCVMNMLWIALALTANIEARTTLEAVMDRLQGYVHVHRALQMPRSGDLVDASAYLRELCRSTSWSKLDQKSINLAFI